MVTYICKITLVGPQTMGYAHEYFSFQCSS